MPAATARITLRTTPKVKAPMQRAAMMTGTSLTGFVLHEAHVAACRVLVDDGSLLLLRQVFASFVAACENPSLPTVALRDLMTLA